MSKILCLFISLSICITFQGEESAIEKIAIIDLEKSIEVLVKERNSYQKKIKAHQDKGRLWQFSKDNFLESRLEYFLAEQEKDKIQLVELKIQNLKELKKEILDE